MHKLIRSEVRELSPYNAGLTIDEVQARYHPPRIAKLGSNENPLGASPHVTTALASLAKAVALYPDPSARTVRVALAKSLDIDAEAIILGNGSEELIAAACRAVLDPGDRMVTFYPSFPLHEDYATTMGANVERVSVEADFSVPLDRLIAAGRGAKMMMFSNPMNPVGTWLETGAFRKLVTTLSPETLLVVDEAYFEYAAGEVDFPSAIDMLRGSDLNWLVLRTLSKAYGLAGLRVGYGVCSSPELRSFLDRVRTPFNSNAAAQMAALAALADLDHLERGVVHNRSERVRIRSLLADNGFRVAPSKGNFLFVDVRQPASVVAEALLTRGVIIKPWRQAGFDHFIRVSIGSSDDNDFFVRSLLEVV
ncbi:histidinol-phosphate aminotransferase [Kaistia soli DSM 19436]|uniref:Histidinol-phosphate aminotransferase n=1 Tax=Kaistia soli DSM 19436 TaxID=1122133 RepID=A0A1M5DJ21_9HYPH|nr:histidinol-phosphate transaminase [Kaistia soli]SHF66905.1 histidinol-phosphate aminotransferase [Kaistia soli DSM 19436]